MAENRKHISSWYVVRDADAIPSEAQGRLLDSLSLCGNPSEAFMAFCREHAIATQFCVSGGEDAYSPERADATIAQYLERCRQTGVGGIDLDFEHLAPESRANYSAFMRKLSAALHAEGLTLSICVGFFPYMYGPTKQVFFQDPDVIAEVCDMVRVMCYDMYCAPCKGKGDFGDRFDCTGMGPTSTQPWAQNAIRYWSSLVPMEKIIMGLPSYSNDYELEPGGTGKQVYAAPEPDVPAGNASEKMWLWWEQVHAYLYDHEDGKRHIYYATDVDSTRAHLETVDEMDVPGISFWHCGMTHESTWQLVREWISAG